MSISIDWQLVWFHLYQLGIAFLLSLPVAWNREYQSRGAGLRTFPLVSIAACAYMLVGMQVYEGSDAEARVMYGIITGMGFIGGGSHPQRQGPCGGYRHGGQHLEYRRYRHICRLQSLRGRYRAVVNQFLYSAVCRALKA